MAKNNPASKNKMVLPKIKGSWWNRDMSMLTTLVPLKYLPIDWIDVPGKTVVDVSPKIDIESLPAVSPLYDGWTLQTDYFFVPHRLFCPTLRINNVEDVGDIDDVEFPLLSFTSYAFDEDNVESHGWNSADEAIPFIASGSLLDRLGYVRGDLFTMASFHNMFNNSNLYNLSYPRTVDVNAIPLLGYLSCWLYRAFNKQDKRIPVESISRQNFGLLDGEFYGERKELVSYVEYDDLKQILPAVAFGKDLAFVGDYVCGYNARGHVFDLGQRLESQVFRDRLVPNYRIIDKVNFTYNRNTFYEERNLLKNTISNTGLLPVTYFGDRFTSWFSDESVLKLQNYTVNSGQSLLSLRRTNSQMLLDMIAMVSGNDYRSFLKFVYGSELDLCDHPILVGSDKISFGFMDVLNQSANVSTYDDVPADKVNQALAFTAGKARSKNNNVRDINFKTREPGLFMVFASLVPTVRYFQGQDPFLAKREFSELWHPQYSSTGFQRPAVREFFSFDVGSRVSSPETFNVPTDYDGMSVDIYQPVGWEYQTGFRKLGPVMNLDRYRTWSLARDFTNYQEEVNVSNIFAFIRHSTSSYGDRQNFDFNFVDTSPEAQNFIINFSAKVSCYQPMSKVLVKPTI